MKPSTRPKKRRRKRTRRRNSQAFSPARGHANLLSVNQVLANQALLLTFEECYRELRPRAPLPQFTVEFFRFVNVNNTIRLRDGQVRVRISDLLEGAPESVLRAIAHILLAKLYRKPIEAAHAVRYRRYLGSR